MAEDNAAAGAPAKKGKLKLIIVIVFLVILAIGLSVVGTLWFLGADVPGLSSGDSAEPEEPQVEVFTPSIYSDIEKALVTTVQGEEGRQRYAQVYLSFAAKQQPTLDAANLHLPLIRSEMIGVLARFNFSELRTPDGRQGLADQLLVAANGVLESEGAVPLEQVLIRNFVIQ